MTDRSSLEERLAALEDLDAAHPPPDGDGRELSEAKKYAIRTALAWRRRDPPAGLSTDLEAARKRIGELLEAAREETSGDDLTVDDIDAAADRLGIVRGVER